MFLNPAALPEKYLRASFRLHHRDETISLGRAFGKVLDPEEKQAVGFIAPMLTGKSSLAKGIYEALGGEYGSLAMAMVAVNGIHEEPVAEKNLLIRHFDMAVHPEDEENIPSHWRKLDAGLPRSGIDLVEHAMRCRGERFSYIFKLSVEEDGARKIDLYCKDDMAGQPAFLEFLRDHA